MRPITQTTESFKIKANKIHNNFYDYSKTIYYNCKIKLIIICKKHGDFEQRPDTHLSGKGCPECGLERRSNLKRLTKKEFEDRSNEKHNYKYNYDEVIYEQSNKKIKIRCPIHRYF